MVDNDSAEVTSSGRSFHVRGPTTGKARLATIVSFTPEQDISAQPFRRRGRSSDRTYQYRRFGARL